MQAQFLRGEGIQTMDYTPGSDVACGDVVVVGDIPAIAVRPIISGELGALNIGGGSYIVAGDAAIAAGVPVYWVDASNKVTATAGANKFFGHAIEACTGDTDLFECSHRTAKT